MRKPCPLCDAAAHANTGSHPSLIATLDQTHVLLGDNQGCRGWCVLVLKSHEEHLAALDAERQGRIFRDVAAVASAIRAVFPISGKDGAPPRINYECLGNLVPHVHWHIIPRHADDPDPRSPVWGFSPAQLKGDLTDADRSMLVERLRTALR